MIDRRTLLSGATFAAGAAMALPAVASVTAAWDAASAPRRRIRSGALGKLQLLQVGVGGSIAPANRHEL